MTGGHDSGHSHAKEAKKSSPKLAFKPILIICVIIGACISVSWCAIQDAMIPNGNLGATPAVQTGLPSQQATPASDPCAGNPAVTVTARPAGTTPEWVSIPMGHCEAVPQTPGIGITYTRVCLNTDRETDTTGVCPNGAYAVGYQSTSSASVQVTTRFRYNPPRG